MTNRTTLSKSPKRKRKTQDEENEFLPNCMDDGEEDGTWDFKEVLDDNVRYVILVFPR